MISRTPRPRSAAATITPTRIRSQVVTMSVSSSRIYPPIHPNPKILAAGEARVSGSCRVEQPHGARSRLPRPSVRRCAPRRRAPRSLRHPLTRASVTRELFSYLGSLWMRSPALEVPSSKPLKGRDCQDAGTLVPGRAAWPRGRMPEESPQRVWEGKVTRLHCVLTVCRGESRFTRPPDLTPHSKDSRSTAARARETRVGGRRRQASRRADRDTQWRFCADARYHR